MPLEILERRPDMVAAERRIAAAFNRIGEAKAARLPALKLNFGSGYLTSEVLELKDDYDPPSAGVSVAMLAPLYAGGALKGHVDIRTTEQHEAIAEYARMALRAIGEVESALAAASSLEGRERILKDSVSRNRRGLELEQVAYRVGRADQRAVLGRQLAVNAAAVTLLRVQSEQLAQRVNLHLALGGSFEEECQGHSTSSLPGVRIEFAATGCVWTVADATAGLRIDYAVEIDPDLEDATPISQSCSLSGPSGLAVFEEPGEDGQRSCRLGPSDTDVLPGTYMLTVKSAGRLQGPDGTTDFEVVGTFPITLEP
jgi:hypothetical protein